METENRRGNVVLEVRIRTDYKWAQDFFSGVLEMLTNRYW